MVSKQQDVSKSETSPVLFMAVDGQPMSFFLRPGPLKRKLQPLIVAGGGAMCSVQQPGAILLIDPAEGGSIPESSTHWYVSTHYIHDCIKENEQLDLEQYRLNPVQVKSGVAPAAAPNTKDACLGGRLPYTAEEDAAILNYINTHKAKTGGNRIWQQMEKERVTNHSWQSMKDHYKVLAKKQSQVVEMASTEGETEGEDTENKIDAPSTSAEDMQVDPQTDQQAVDSPVEAESFNSPDREQLPSETALPETAVSPQNGPGSRGRTKQKLKSPPMLVPPQRRSTRRHPQLQESPSPQQNSRRVRSSAHREEQPSPKPSPKKTKSVAQVDPQEEDEPPSVEEPPSKKTRGKRVSESPSDQTKTASASETEPTPQKAKNQPKRTLGILEMATKEFECSSDESDADQLDSDNPPEPEIKNPKETAPPLITEDTAASPQSTLESEPVPPENPPETQAVANGLQPPEGAAEAVDATSEAHLFIFDNESQEEDSQATSGDGPAPDGANRQPRVNAVATYSLTQTQLEDDKRRMEELMNETQQDLVSVTKALLKTSGDFSEARLLLVNSPGSGPLWNICDDDLLMSGDSTAREQLQGKYGEEAVAKRIVFLELQA